MKRLAPLLVFFCCSCTEPKQQPDTPAGVAEAFSRALQQGDTQTAWSYLSAKTQAEANHLAEHARVSADAGPKSGQSMLFGGVLPLGAVSATELGTDGGEALISVVLDGGAPRQYRAIYEGGLWKLEIPLSPGAAD